MESVRATNAGRAIAKKVGNMYSKDKSYLGELSGKIGKFPKENRSCVRWTVN